MSARLSGIENCSRMVRYWLEHPPTAPATPVKLHGERCPVEGCRTIACGTTEQEAAYNLVLHRRREHANRRRGHAR